MTEVLKWIGIIIICAIVAAVIQVIGKYFNIESAKMFSGLIAAVVYFNLAYNLKPKK